MGTENFKAPLLTGNPRYYTSLNSRKVGINQHITGDYRDQGSSYLKALSSLWGLGEVITVAAWNLDYMPVEKVVGKVRETADLARSIAEEF